MVDIALEYLVTMSEKVQNNVNFKVEDATTINYPENFYDLVSVFNLKNVRPLADWCNLCLLPGIENSFATSVRILYIEVQRSEV